MFLKISKVKDFEYLRIVQSSRTKDNKVRHKTIVNLGRADKVAELFSCF
ncbi:hypothetical protein JCM13304A_10730 [Desulfothermus okinawensis JCM 13304]